MKNTTALAVHPEYNMYQKNNTAYCSSLQVAEAFGKQHFHVLRDIEALGQSKIGESSEAGQLTSGESSEAGVPKSGEIEAVLSMNMIYRIVLGMDVKTFREIHGLKHGESIRPLLSDAQHKAIRNLQTEDIRMLYRGIDYQKRKLALTAKALPAKI